MSDSMSRLMDRLTPFWIMVILVAAGSGIRLILATTMGLGVDESYAVSIARSLSLSYLDHPPLHYWIIWLASHLTGSENALILRLPFIIVFAGTTWLMFCLGRFLFGEWAGVYAAITLNLSLVFSISTGSWILPDGTLMFFLMLTSLSLARLLFPPRTDIFAVKWLWVGLWLGFSLLSKYYAIFVLLGFFVYAATSKFNRRQLFANGPYLATAIAFLIFAPVLIWNYEHGWVSFLYQGSRGAIKGISPAKMALNLAGQALWILPWIWLPLLWSLKEALRKPFVEDESVSMQDRRWFLCCLALGPILFFTILPLWTGRGLPHWPASGYLFLFPLLGEQVAEALHRDSRRVRHWLRNSAVAFLLIVLALGTHIRFGWMTMSVPLNFARNDPTLDLLDWSDINAQLESRGILNSSARFVITENWIDAGKIDYALGGRLPVLCFNEYPHHFAFMHDPADFKGLDALIIGRKEYRDFEAAYSRLFDSLTLLAPLSIQRNGRPSIELMLVHASNFNGRFPE